MTETGFGAENEIKAPNSFFKFDKVGARFVGIYRGREERPNGMDSTGEYPTQMVHEFSFIEAMDSDVNEFKENDTVLCSKAGGSGITFNKTLELIPFGSVVGIAFTEEVPSKKKGYRPTKVIKVYNSKELDEKYAKYLTKDDETKAAVETMPF